MIANAAPWSFALKQQYVARLPAGVAVRGLRLDRARREHGSCEPEDQLRKPGSCGKAAPLRRDPAVRRRRQRRHRHRPRGHRRAVRPQPARLRRLLQAARQVRGGPARRLPDRRRHRLPRRRGLLLHLRPQEGHDHLGRDEHLPGRDRGGARGSTPTSTRRRCSASRATSGARPVHAVVVRAARAPTRRGRRAARTPASTSPATRCRARSRGSTSCPRPARARSSSASCAPRYWSDRTANGAEFRFATVRLRTELEAPPFSRSRRGARAIPRGCRPR